MKRVPFALVASLLFAVGTRGERGPSEQLTGKARSGFPASSATHVEYIEREEGRPALALMRRDGRPLVRHVDAGGIVRVIVEFRETPLLIQKLDNARQAQPESFYRARFDQLSKDLTAMQLRLPSGSKPAVIRRTLHGLFFGASVELPEDLFDHVAALSYVKAVHADDKVSTCLDESVHIIRADSVWTDYGTRGSGVKVAIIDTGIDYTHPALGGGFGPGYKVIGGYDVIDDDDDPIDVFGHGTHVAGIVAADSEDVTGVAPDCSLIAIKVFSLNLPTFDSDVIAGIERAVDPDADGDTSDRADIANMSIGSPRGEPDGPVSVAVDNATRLGLTSCVAAGNQGWYYMLDSPGVARTAITVGGTDKADKWATFSSRGPVQWTASLKPDVMAPGQDITSTLPGGGYAPMSGTSMATPHVAGACALLKALHPDWTPQQIKSALMTTAVDIGVDVMTQGAGRIDALNAARVKTFAAPSSLSFGLDDGTTSTWRITRTVTVSNAALTPQQYGVTFSGLRGGVRLKALPASFELGAGQAREVSVTLTVDNGTVPFPKDRSLGYSGSVIVSGSKDQLHLPWAFVKARRVQIVADKMGSFDFFDDAFLAYAFGKKEFRFIAPRGEFSMISGRFLSEPWVARFVTEGPISTRDGSARVNVSFAQADNAIALNGVDNQGRLLSSLQGSETEYSIVSPKGSMRPGWALSNFPGKVYFSDFSNEFGIKVAQFHLDLAEAHQIHLVEHALSNGLHGDVSVSNSPSDFVTQRIRADFSRNATAPALDFALVNAFLTREHGAISFSGHAPTSVTGSSWEGTAYLTPPKTSSSRQFTQRYGTAVLALDSIDQPPYFSTAPILVTGNGMSSYWGYRPPPGTCVFPDGGEMRFGGAPPVYPRFFTVNNIIGKSNIYVAAEFHGELDEFRASDAMNATFALRDKAGRKIASGPLVQLQPMDVDPGRYELEVKPSYDNAQPGGAARMVASFDLGGTDANAPVLTSLKLLTSAGLPAAVVAGTTPEKLRFSAADYAWDEFFEPTYQKGWLDDVHAYYRVCGTGSWIALPLTLVTEDADFKPLPVGFVWESALPPLTGCKLDLKIMVRDNAGNSVEWVLEPAFVPSQQ